MASEDEWALGYAKQARSDLAARNALTKVQHVDECHRLHFLQMACEKICKAYLCGQGSKPKDVQTSHAYVAKSLPTIVREQYARSHPKGMGFDADRMRKIRHLAREIELLAPAVDDNGRREDNSEYPWEDDAGHIHVPAEHQFTTLNFLKEPLGREFLKAIYAATDRIIGDLTATS